MNYNKIPFLKKIYTKFDIYQKQINSLSDTINLLVEENINLRFKIKKIENTQINILFICWRPAIWGSLKSIYEILLKDDSFNCKIITIPNKKQLYKMNFQHEVYETEGAEDFWKDDNSIQGYDYSTKQWIDLKSLKPDYVFFQQPYNVTRSLPFKSWEVSKYCKICYVEYGYNTNKKIAIDCLPKDFIQDVSLFFLQNKTEEKWYKDYFLQIKNTKTKTFVTGFPRFDNLKIYENIESKIWKSKKNDRFRVIWTPRWCLNENNCHFFKYKNQLFDYAFNNLNIDFLFRPHPQAYDNWIALNLISKKEINELEKKINDSQNVIIDKNKEYLSSFYSSDCLITDYTSLIGEYFITGKPIIYCHNKESIVDPEGKITEGFYYVSNWSELQKTLLMLEKGQDPLKQKRLEIIKSEFIISEETAASKIVKIIKKDFYK